ncbi:TetR/AcrR family transcriptional regulator [Streptomyces goshikiensis]|uniref:TetR/AcrR family transcriptional regulator n=1 Tax=Streptomyces goshikiensis TaxID=1942 RepID=UPI0036FF2F11
MLPAADDLLVEHGFGALAIEAIARRADVAKQTIYRCWPSKVEILLDTLIEDSNKRLLIPTEQPTAESIRGYVRDFARFLVSDPAGKVLLALIAEAQHDSATAESFHERCLGPRRQQERDMIASGFHAGEVSPRLGPDATLDALVGPIVHCAPTRSSMAPVWWTPSSRTCSGPAPIGWPLGFMPDWPDRVRPRVNSTQVPSVFAGPRLMANMTLASAGSGEGVGLEVQGW